MSVSELIVSVSGIRGVVGESLTPEAATAFATALGTYLEGRPVVLSRDSRPSGEMLRDAVAAGLMSAGCDIYHLSIAPTPTVGLAILQVEAAGGVQITASHNPAPYNGLKLFGPRGMVLTADEGRQVLDIYQNTRFRRAPWNAVGTCRMTRENPMRFHLGRILASVEYHKIQKRRFKVFLDGNHGAGGPLGLLLLHSTLECQVVKAGTEPDGQFAHEPEPTEENLRELAPQVAAEKCDVGFALDPDADRLAIIDETGRYIGEELTLALATQFRLWQARGPVVANMSTSRIVEDVCTKLGATFHRAPVGEVNVAQKMIQVDALIGGEGNGGVIDPRIGYVRDPYIGMALILNLMVSSGKKLSELVAELPRYHIVKAKHSVERDALPALYSGLKAKWPEAKINEEDGLRLDWPDRWLHVRPSNTEPIVRIIAEAPTREEAEGLCKAAKGV
jgi:phosphomannomutase